MPKFSIIIPVCGNLELTKKCVESIEKYTTLIYKKYG
jgi:GT2 family glycosyltransferase